MRDRAQRDGDVAAVAPIQVLGAWPDAEMVIVTGLVSSLQSFDTNTARPVESVSPAHGSCSSVAPTRTAALDSTSRVSSSMT